jgi:glycosyltransferase involved in cell wall biosynthesis
VFDAQTRSLEELIGDPDTEVRRSMDLLGALESAAPEQLLSRRKPSVAEPLVSVIVPTYNASRWIGTALKSLLAQTANVEILVVDDASEDDTFVRARQAVGGDARVRLVRLRQNVGVYQVRNWAASQLARGEWISFQDADDFSHPNRFAMQLEYAQVREASACGCFAHQFFPSDLRPWRANTPRIEHGGYGHTLTFYPETSRIAGAEPVSEVVARLQLESAIQHINGVSQSARSDSLALYSTLMYRKESFLELGGFDGHTRVGGDRTFAYRWVRFHGIANTPAVLYSRRIHGDSLTQRRDTGFESDSRLRHFSSFEQLERGVIEAAKKGAPDRVRDLCRSDLYCGDVHVSELL